MNWAVVSEYPTLLVSDTGRVVRMASSRLRKLRNGKQCWQTFPEQELSPRRIGAGYLSVQVKLNGGRRDLYVHRLVAEAFVQRQPDRNEVNHIDGNKHNNVARNLEWVTHAENHQHAARTGLAARASLTPEQVREIRAVLATGRRVRDVAADFGVTASTVSHIKNRHCWAWLE